MKKKKKITKVKTPNWQCYIALCYFYHPFREGVHLRKRKIRVDGEHCDIWSDTFKCWWDFPLNNVCRIISRYV